MENLFFKAFTDSIKALPKRFFVKVLQKRFFCSERHFSKINTNYFLVFDTRQHNGEDAG